MQVRQDDKRAVHHLLSVGRVVGGIVVVQHVQTDVGNGAHNGDDEQAPRQGLDDKMQLVQVKGLVDAHNQHADRPQAHGAVGNKWLQVPQKHARDGPLQDTGHEPSNCDSYWPATCDSCAKPERVFMLTEHHRRHNKPGTTQHEEHIEALALPKRLATAVGHGGKVVGLWNVVLLVLAPATQHRRFADIRVSCVNAPLFYMLLKAAQCALL